MSIKKILIILAFVVALADILTAQRPAVSQLTEDALFAQLGRCNATVELRVKDLQAQDAYIKQLETRISELEGKKPSGDKSKP